MGDITNTDKFAGTFEGVYDGSQDNEAARYSFVALTNYRIIWTQVHGDFKNAAKVVLFEPYPHWRELHECCGLVVRAAVKMDKTQIYTERGCARMMGDAMTVLMKKYGHRVPRWWIPLMQELRGERKPKVNAQQTAQTR
jgi:hypothetical protein